MKKICRIGFTLIELLIVVAIIAILAAIAVPNFLESQVRAKVARAWADQRTCGTAFEAYAVDNRGYPPVGAPPQYSGWNGWWLDGCYFITTPIAYLTSNKSTQDPFQKPGTWPQTDIYDTNSYLHYDLRTLHPWYVQTNNYYCFMSFGPGSPHLLPNGGPPFYWTPYDPSNGTVSAGLIMFYGPSGRHWWKYP
jgi:prepilin-type N-terminal cleavage/methylation domain-containing protein